MQRPPKIPKKPSLSLDTNIVQDNLPQEVVPGIFIGSIHAAFNQEALLAKGITHILNASRVPATFPKHFTYLSIDIRDREDANILSCIPASNIFLEAGMDAGGVLIHCFGGRSRSAALVCAYLMSSRGWTLDHALEEVVRARPVAAVNRGFARQLQAYMQTTYDVFAAQQVLLRNRIMSLKNYRSGSASGGRAGTDRVSREKFDPTAGNEDGLAGSVSPGRLVGIGGAMDGNGGHKRWRPLSGGTGRDGHGQGQSSVGDHGAAAAAMLINMTVDGDEEDADAISLRGGQESEMSPMPMPVSTRHGGAGGRTSGGSSSSGGTSGDLIPISAEGFAPNCRLSRPGSSTVRIIPPLRGLERRYGCLGCGRSLFSLANVVREPGDAHIIGEPRPRSDSSDLDSKLRSSFGSDGGASDRDSQGQMGFKAPIGHCSPKNWDAAGGSGSGGGGQPQHKRGHWSHEDVHGSVPMQVASSAPVSLPMPQLSRRHAEAKPFSFSFGAEAEDKGFKGERGDSFGSSPRSGGGGGGGNFRDDSEVTAAAEASSHMVLARSPDDSNGNFAAHRPGSSGSASGTAQSRVPLMRSLNIPVGGGQAKGCSPGHHQLSRPASAEKRRWLARVSLLKADPKDSMSRHPDVPDAKSAKLAADDQGMVDYFVKGKTPYLLVEYMEWMGAEPLRGCAEEGTLECPTCQRPLGSWLWPAGSSGEASNIAEEVGMGTSEGFASHPQFKVQRSAVQLADLPLDATPMSTPRLDPSPRDPLDMSGGGDHHQRSLSGDMHTL